ncbi:MAG: DUF1385 domain-containing protein [Oscillospiraceae bacterium]|nr:DUF1385 domain-containing protein [Oscillospiraceae bacterium]
MNEEKANGGTKDENIQGENIQDENIQGEALKDEALKDEASQDENAGSEGTKNATSKEFRTSIGGQALLEGIMMRGPKKQAIVVRTKDGFVTKTEELKLLKEKHPIVGFVFIRGVVNFVSSMAIGMRAIMFSAEQIPEEEQGEPSRFDQWVEKRIGNEKAEKILIIFALILGIAISVGLFMLLPTVLTGLITNFVSHRILRNLIEGALRITIFLLYMWLATRLEEMKRMWGYHGAEHKAIFCYEKCLPLTVENVRTQSRLHPRCGTSFLFIVMLVSILVFSFTGWSNIWIRIGFRLALIPVVVGISYEIIKLAGRYDNILTKIVSAPGKALQRLTTREPDDEMIETAIEALALVIPENASDAEW